MRDDSDHDLAELERAQRSAEPTAGVVQARETTRVRIPAEGRLPQSTALLERLYRDGLVAREKKPMVVDTRRSYGPYMVSIDASPLVVLDACSQIATLSHGFASRWLLRELHEGGFADCLWSNPDTLVEGRQELAEYAQALRELAPAGLDHVCFVMAGGAEANEKAMRMARLHAPAGLRRRVLAFRNGFHGRTLATLMATWNPAKRGPFELAGYEAVFAEATLDDVTRCLQQHGEEIYAVLVEPMMAEGGDVYLEPAFLAGLRALTRQHHLPLIVDEVQTGFGTGGPFLWWDRMVGDDVEPPDLITLAKKAQLGVVLSRWPDPEPAPVHVASVVRGLVGLLHIGPVERLERHVGRLLAELEKSHAVVSHPRVTGTTFAFDLPTADDVRAFIEQRFQRGLMTYPAGERTIRFRLNASWSRRHIEDLFRRIETAIKGLHDEEATRWPVEGATRRRREVGVRSLQDTDWPAIHEIEQQSYEPARRAPESLLRTCQEHGYAFVAYDIDDGEVLGCAFAAPVELFPELDGPRQDTTRGQHTTLYSADVTVAPAARGRAVGLALKRHQLEWARDRGFWSVVGRNKVGATDAMMAMVRAFGAYVVGSYEGQYDGESSAEYYRIPLRNPPPPEPSAVADCASGIQRPMGHGPAGMAVRELVGPTTCRLNLSNYATLDAVHYLEHLRHVLPRGTSHIYTTSSRDETVDKSLRCLRLSRPAAEVAVGFEGGYVGHTTAAARSLSDPAGFGPDFSLFEWPRVPHPARDGVSATIAALDSVVQRHGASRLFGLFVEVVGERSGLVLDGEAAKGLSDWCGMHDVPLVLVETASGCHRAGPSAWGIDALPSTVVSDLVLWYPGGQLGHIFCGDRYWIDRPLTLISTWDGEELSMIRAHEVWRAAWRLDMRPAVDALNALVNTVAKPARQSARVGGRGLYRTVTFADATGADHALSCCERAGMIVGRGAPGTLVFAPPLDIDAARLGAIIERLREVPSLP